MLEGSGCVKVGKDVLFGLKKNERLVFACQGRSHSVWEGSVLGDNGRIRTRKGQCLSGVVWLVWQGSYLARIGKIRF